THQDQAPRGVGGRYLGYEHRTKHNCDDDESYQDPLSAPDQPKKISEIAVRRLLRAPVLQILRSLSGRGGGNECRWRYTAATPSGQYIDHSAFVWFHRLPPPVSRLPVRLSKLCEVQLAQRRNRVVGFQ